MSQSFVAQLDAFTQLVKQRERLLFQRVTAHVGRSIRFGSAVTGAPGQPVKSGDLRDSYYPTGSFASRLVGWQSDLFYAPIIEDNWRGAKLRSKVGGFHSVKLTRNGFQNIVRHELRIVKSAVKAPKGRGSKLRDPRTGRFV